MKLKSTLIVLSIIGLTISQVGHAKSKPILYDSCRQQITFPKGASGYVYMSKNCKKAFIPLREHLPIKIVSLKFDPSVNEKNCKQMEGLNDELLKIKAEIVNLRSQQGELRAALSLRLETASVDDLDKIWLEHSLLNSKLENAITNLKINVHDLELKLPYSTNKGIVVTNKLSYNRAPLLKQFSELNKHSRIKFKPAKIQNGTFWFSIPDESILLRSILGLSIPGVTPNGTYLQDGKVKSNGDLLIDVTYSQAWACSEIKRLQTSHGVSLDFDKNLITKENSGLGSFFANFSYEVPVANYPAVFHTSGFGGL